MMELKKYLEHDPELLLSEKRTRALLRDAYQNDILRVNLMMSAYSTGIIAEIRRTSPTDQFALARWVQKLTSDYGIDDDKARWAVNEWKSAISPFVLRELDAAEQRQLVAEAAARAASQQQEPEYQSAKADALHVRDDYEKYYINPALKESENYIYVPCGFGQGDNGFLIYGIKKERLCNHRDANVFALIYNYLTRNSIMTERDIPRLLKEQDGVYEPDYQTIYRLTMTLLQMVRHNYTRDEALVINYSEDMESLNYAIRLIDHYAALFSRLIGIEAVRLQIENNKSGISLSLHNRANVYVVDNRSIISNARELWYGRKINYHLTEKNRLDLEYILSEISDFDGFKEGQLSALCDMLSCKKHSVCIMPTGSGKSLIFYMASLLQPLPMFIVSPTDILIRDQIRNLKKFHRIDNVAHLQLNDENSFAEWDICNSLNYLTPMTFQNRHLLVKFRYLNNGTKLIKGCETRLTQGALVSYVVLDEIHCLSNWGHDFRPEYLMLSKNLNKFFDHISFLGFSATANYTVVEDVQKQLDIPQENFFSPIAFERFNVSYDFRVLHSEEKMLKEVAAITASLVSRNERTLIFTKNDVVSQKVADAIGYEADIFTKENQSAYYHFAVGESKVLVASDELGIGVNLPNIRNIIHFGLPLSKNEYVQEIGRAGRANEKVTSFVLYLAASPNNVPDGLLRRDTPIQDLPVLLNGFQNDYTDVYQKLSNGAISDQELCNQLIKTYHNIAGRNKAAISDTYPFADLGRVKQQLYMLYLTGYINDWYSYAQPKLGNGIEIFIDICTTDAESYRKDPKKMLNRMKERMHDYFVYMGNNRESISLVERAGSPEEIIQIYVKWYYKRYLYHHNEQFLDFFEFITDNSECNSERITEEIKDYFVLPFAKLKSDEALYNVMPVNEIISKATTGISKNTLINLERINSNRYSYKLDLALFCGQLRVNDSFDESRLNRIRSKLPKEELTQLSRALSSLYPSCGNTAKLDILRYMETEATSLGTNYREFLQKAYKDGQKDEIYYGIMAGLLNKYFDEMRRTHHV